jgi:hypothetical protein
MIKKNNITNIIVSNNQDYYNMIIKINVPNILIKNVLNFRIFKIKKDNDYIRDPDIQDSFYIENIPSNLIGKSINFNFSFKKEIFEEIEEFYFDFCDEQIAWANKVIFYKNIYFSERQNNKKIEKSLLSKDMVSYLISDKFLKMVNE